MVFPLTAYFEAAMELAHYEKLTDGTYAGEVPKLAGVVAFGGTLKECERELRATVEDWVLVGLRLGHPLPKLAGIDLNKRRHGRAASAQKA
ncbi:MAG: type II toxin-antitoxin system HicB family antitoxin [Verrucomicrobiota bacterium]